MVETIFRGGKVQTGHRIKIPKAVIDTLNLKIGTKIIIKFDAEKRLIIMGEERQKIK